MKLNFYAILALFVSFTSLGQSFPDAEIVRWNKQKTIPMYVKLISEKAPLEQNVQDYLRKAYNFSENTSLKQYQSLTDKLGMKHLRYQVYLNDIPVDGSVLIAHLIHGRLHSFNGEYYGAIQESKTIGITKEKALENALNHFDANVYMWELDEESHVHEYDEDIYQKPKAELFYAESGQSLRAENYLLAYRFNIYSAEPHARKYIYINAKDGAFLKEEDLIHTGDIKGRAVTKYSDTVDIFFDSLAPSSFRLRQTTHGKGIETFDMNKGTSYGAAVDFENTIKFWDSANTDQDEVALDAHWGAEKTYEYFLIEHNRRSFDDQDAKIRSYVHRGVNYNNAFWNGSVMTYGDGNNSRFTPLTCIDVCGHEVSHAVTTYSAGLVYRYESGALNESFSDIFGNAIERFARPNQYSYKIGEDITPSGNGLRNMARPNANGHPDTYLGTSWRTGTGDNGGVHSNSGVQNFWYYILSEGDTASNDNSDAYSVPGIGYQKAADVAYRNLTVYLTKNSQYADARYYGIRAAVDLFGDCSSEMIQTTNAWYAVGVGDEYKDSVEVGFEAAKKLFCFTQDTVKFTNLSINSSTYSWFFGDGGTSNVRNPSYLYSTYGTFTVKLVAGNCNGTIFDSITLTDYITIDSSRLVCKSDLMPEFGTGSIIRNCEGYLMDNGGENDYLTLRTTIRTIAPYNATKVHAEFLQFRMENRFDSLYVYDGLNTSGTLLGGYTGTTLPPDLVANSGAMTFKHFADPLEVDSGFIVKYYAEKLPLSIVAPKDTTICINTELVLVAGANGGGDTSELEYYWTAKDTMLDTLRISPIKDTLIRVYVYDNCMKEYDTAYVQVKVNPVLELSVSKDTILCFGNSTDITAMGSGGVAKDYFYTWDKGLGSGPTKTVDGSRDSLFTVILSDGCSVLNDTATIKVLRRDSLALSLNKDTLLCEGNKLELIALGTGGNGNYTYTWDNGLGTGSSKMINPVITTKYKVTLSDGCSVPSLTDSVVVIMRDSLKIDLQKDSTLCIGESLDLITIVSGGDPLNYTWSWDNGAGNVNNQNISPLVTTKYKVVFSDGCSIYEPSDSVTIQVRDPLMVTLFKDSTICYGNTIDLLAVANGGDAANYTFTWDNGLGTGNPKIITPLVTTSYQVILNDACTSKEDRANVTITVLDSLVLTKSRDTSICIGESVNLIVSATGGKPGDYTYTWNQGLGAGTNFLVSPGDTTTYIVTISDGCSNPVTDSIKVNVILKPLVDFSASDTMICTSDSIAFTNTSKGILGTVFQWNFGNGLTSSIENPTIIFTKEGTFPVTLLVKNDAGCEGTITKNKFIDVLPSPVAAFSYTPDEPDAFNTVVTIKNDSKNATKYLWDFGNGSTSSNPNPRVDYGDTGTFAISLTASNDIGCTAETSVLLHVKDVFRLFFPTSFTPNDDALNDYFVPIGRGIVSSETTIMNRWGEVLFKSTLAEPYWNGSINNKGSIVPNGAYVYVLRIFDVDNNVHSISGMVTIIR